jgi:hypothetical protein
MACLGLEGRDVVLIWVGKKERKKGLGARGITYIVETPIKEEGIEGHRDLPSDSLRDIFHEGLSSNSNPSEPNSLSY